MFKEIFLFEIKYRLKQRLFYIFTIVMFLVTAIDFVNASKQYGNINMNSPFIIMQLMLGMSIIGVFVTTAIMANAIIRDNELNTHSIFYTKPISKFDYLIGRFTGSFIISFLIFWGAALGIMVSSIMPWQDPTRIGSFYLNPYLFSLFALVLPNVYILGAIFYSLATLTRNIYYTYVGVIILFSAFFGISETVLGNLEQETLTALLDPFGVSAFNSMTKYWTVAERNTMLVPMEGILLQNRLLWCSIASLILLLTYLKFQFSEIVSKKSFKKKQEEEREVLDLKVGSIEWNIPFSTQIFSKELNLRQFLNQTKIETLDIIKRIPLIIIFSFFILNTITITSLYLSESLYGTSLYPVTYLMVDNIQNLLIWFFIIITIYSGELVWKERTKRVNEIYDVLPTANWVPFVSKLTALIIITLILLTCAIITGIGIQIYHGYYNFELLQYIKSLFFLVLIPSVLASVLGMFIQTIVNNKFIGYMFMVIFYVGIMYLSGMGFDHNLYLYTGFSYMIYSDMNGYGNFVTPEVWFSGYRLFFAVILSVISILFWIRGSETQIKLRLKLAKQRFNKPLKGIAGFASIAFLLTGSFIFYNTNIINEYKTNNKIDAEGAAYEKRYKKYEGIPQPKITEVMANVDIYPDERNVDIHGTYVLVNKTTTTIDSLHILLDNDLNINSLDVPESKLVLEDKKVTDGYYIYELNRPLQPADSITLSYELSYITRGFSNDNSNTTVLYNGTSLSNMQYFPHIGYNENFELEDKNKRRKYGLPPIERMASVTDSLARMNNFISKEADWINFETIVSTTPEQIAIAPGTLQREWIENGRRFFHYKVNVPIINFFMYLSADYAVKKDSWKDIDIGIYYHKTHTYNIDRMINAIKNSLEYFTTNFSPYQHKQILIVEFPHHLGGGATSLANIIPYSEAIGFISKYKGGDDIDLIYYVTAHELAHQWWGYQVIGANVQGFKVLTETLAQYSSLMVMEKENGREAMKKFLKYELDSYLKDRGREILKELPLIFNEGQTYIAYHKGSLVMYALRDYIGEETLNHALSKFVKEFAFQGPPYPTSLDLLRYIKEVTPDSLYYVIEDMFETITLYDNKTTEATFSMTGDGKYLVNLTIEAKKLRADSLGVETEIPINDWIYIGVLGEKEDVNGTMVNKELYIAKHKIDKPVMEFEIIVDELPKKAGIDPYCMLIDRNWDNNLIRVEKK